MAMISIVDHALPYDTHNLYDVTFYAHNIHTLLTSSPSMVDSWLTETLNLHSVPQPQPLIAGLDVEWRPNSQRNMDNPVAVLQICVGSRCLIFQILHSPNIPKSLFDFLANSDHTFLGVGIEEDVEKLICDYNLSVGKFVDLRDLAADKLGDKELKRSGIKTLALRVLEKEIEKPKSVSRSRWDYLWLTPEQIWKLKVPERCKVFVWTAAHKRLLTNVSRRRRGLCSDESCGICHAAHEDLGHVLRDCPETLQIWKKLVPSEAWHSFMSLQFSDWFKGNLIGRKTWADESWGESFALTCWWLWRRRNSLVFEGKNISNGTIITSVKAAMVSMGEARRRFYKGINGQVQLDLNMHKWQPPDPGWVKINVDGAFSYRTNEAACGGLLRAEDGSFIVGFMCKIMEGDCLSAELWGCLHGLKLAWDMGFRQVVIESDSHDAVRLLSEEGNGMHEDAQIITEAKLVLARNWSTKVALISRWVNKAADCMAIEALSTVNGFHLVLTPWQVLQGLIDEDRQIG